MRIESIKSLNYSKQLNSNSFRAILWFRVFLHNCVPNSSLWSIRPSVCLSARLCVQCLCAANNKCLTSRRDLSIWSHWDGSKCHLKWNWMRSHLMGSWEEATLAICFFSYPRKFFIRHTKMCRKQNNQLAAWARSSHSIISFQLI